MATIFCPLLPSSVNFATCEVNREDLQKKDARMQVNVLREDEIRSAVPAALRCNSYLGELPETG
jgi:hypothetical protein